MRKPKFVLLFLFLVLVLTACQLGIVTPPPPAPLPTWTPSSTPLPPTAAPTVTPTITPTPPLNSSNGPPLISLHMFTLLDGWGLIENQLLTTTDGGFTWAGVPVPCGQFNGRNGAFFQNENTAYILTTSADGSRGTLCITEDRGQHWQDFPVPPTNGQVQFLYTGVEGFILQSQGFAAGSEAVRLYYTFDRVTWEKVFETDPATAPENLPLAGRKSGFLFVNPGKGWMTGSLPQENFVYLFVTGDSGRHWQQVPLSIPAGFEKALIETRPPFFFAPGQGLLPVDFLLPGGEPQTVFYLTTDEGQTWTPTTPLPRATTYGFVDTKTGWVWAGRKLYATTDLTQPWTDLPFSLPARETVVQFNLINPTTGWMLTVDDKSRVHLYRTNDGAATWSVVIP